MRPADVSRSGWWKSIGQPAGRHTASHRRQVWRARSRSGAPVVLLPHGYPSSSFQYRSFMPALGDGWRLIAPDYPGFGYSATPDRGAFSYAFARYALYLFDYGSQIGFQLALQHPERIAALIIQDGDAYEETLGPKYEALPSYQAYLRQHRPPTLIVWGPNDGYMPEAAARAHLSDLPGAELHLIDDGGHWLLETHLDEVVTLTRDFLQRVHP